jgi:hypothetical protein
LLHGSSRKSPEQMITGLPRAPNVEATASYSQKIKKQGGPVNTRLSLSATSVAARVALALIQDHWLPSHGEVMSSPPRTLDVPY